MRHVIRIDDRRAASIAIKEGRMDAAELLLSLVPRDKGWGYDAGSIPESITIEESDDDKRWEFGWPALVLRVPYHFRSVTFYDEEPAGAKNRKRAVTIPICDEHMIPYEEVVLWDTGSEYSTIGRYHATG